MSGLELTGEDFMVALDTLGVRMDIDKADDWFETLKRRGLIDLDLVYAAVVSADSIEEEAEALTAVMTAQLKERGGLELILSERDRKKMDIETAPAPRPQRSHTPRL